MNVRVSTLLKTSLILTFLPALAVAQHDAGVPQLENIEISRPKNSGNDKGKKENGFT